MQASAVLLCKCDEILLDSSTATEDLNFLGGRMDPCTFLARRTLHKRRDG